MSLSPSPAEEPIDPDDYLAAVARPSTPVTTDDEALQGMLDQPFERWQVFLHPAQGKLVERRYNGPTRVGGGPGTGKTIVALHRVAHLAEQLDASTDKPILLTTFNRNLAADLRARLLTLGGERIVSGVDIVNIDKLEMLSGETYDDLDGGTEDLAGYRSLLHGDRPQFRGVRTWADEKDLIVTLLRAWGSATDGSIAICLPTKPLVAEVIARLEADGIAVTEIGPDGPIEPDGVHIGTMHRFKGLEYQRIILGAVSDGLVPRSAIAQYLDLDPKRYQRERARDRSVLFVAATRARDDLAIFWHGTRSPFLTHRFDRQM